MNESVVHPTNPPHLIPLVEVAPSPWTSGRNRERGLSNHAGGWTKSDHCQKGNSRIYFESVARRLINEALRLADGDYASPDDIDCAVRDGLGLRWSFMGPFETIDLNAPGGLADYAERYGNMYRDMSVSQSLEMTWDKNLIDRIHHDRRSILDQSRIEERQAWRDQQLAALIAHKNNKEKKTNGNK